MAWFITIAAATALAFASNAITRNFGKALLVTIIGTIVATELYLWAFEGYVWTTDKFAGLAAGIMGLVGFAACSAVRVGIALWSEDRTKSG